MMPGSLEKRLNDCDLKIDSLFHGVEVNAEIERQLKLLKEYYRKLYMDVSGDDEEQFIELYELFVSNLESVKNGQRKQEDVLKEIEESSSLRKTGIILENIVTSLDLLFWATTAGTFFTYCSLIAMPMIAVNPFIALGLLTIASTLAIYAIEEFVESTYNFKSISPVEEEHMREKNLISFFKPKSFSLSTSTKALKKDELNEEQRAESLYPHLDVQCSF